MESSSGASDPSERGASEGGRGARGPRRGGGSWGFRKRRTLRTSATIRSAEPTVRKIAPKRPLARGSQGPTTQAHDVALTNVMVKSPKRLAPPTLDRRPAIGGAARTTRARSRGRACRRMVPRGGSLEVDARGPSDWGTLRKMVSVPVRPRSDAARFDLFRGRSTRFGLLCTGCGWGVALCKASNMGLTTAGTESDHPEIGAQTSDSGDVPLSLLRLWPRTRFCRSRPDPPEPMCALSGSDNDGDATTARAQAVSLGERRHAVPLCFARFSLLRAVLKDLGQASGAGRVI